VDKIPREYSSTKIVQSSNFLPVVMDEILRTAARSARTRFFPDSSRCLVDEIPRAAAKSARGTGVVKIQTNKISWEHWQWDRNREVDTKHIDVDYGFGLLTNVEKITESPRNCLQFRPLWQLRGISRGRRPRGFGETPPFSLSPRPIDSTTRDVVP